MSSSNNWPTVVRNERQPRQRQRRPAGLRNCLLGVRGVLPARHLRAALLPRHGHRSPLLPGRQLDHGGARRRAPLPAHSAARRRGVPLARRLPAAGAPADRRRSSTPSTAPCTGADQKTPSTASSRASCAWTTQSAASCMPCAHEVARLRCAQRLGLCPVCRTPVSATLRTRSAADGLPGTPSVRPRVSCRPSRRTRPPRTARPPPSRPTRASRGWAASAAPSGRRTASSCRARTRSAVPTARGRAAGHVPDLLDRHHADPKDLPQAAVTSIRVRMSTYCV